MLHHMNALAETQVERNICFNPVSAVRMTPEASDSKLAAPRAYDDTFGSNQPSRPASEELRAPRQMRR
jgi:hypothetical protein